MKYLQVFTWRCSSGNSSGPTFCKKRLNLWIVKWIQTKKNANFWKHISGIVTCLFCVVIRLVRWLGTTRWYTLMNIVRIGVIWVALCAICATCVKWEFPIFLFVHTQFQFVYRIMTCFTVFIITTCTCWFVFRFYAFSTIVIDGGWKMLWSLPTRRSIVKLVVTSFAGWKQK